MLCYVHGEQLDKLCFSAGHLIRYWKKCKILCTGNVYVSYCIFWEIKHLNLNIPTFMERSLSNGCSTMCVMCNMFMLHCVHTPIIMVVADGLVPVWIQDICNPHDNEGQSQHVRSVLTWWKRLKFFMKGNLPHVESASYWGFSPFLHHKSNPCLRTLMFTHSTIQHTLD